MAKTLTAMQRLALRAMLGVCLFPPGTARATVVDPSFTEATLATGLIGPTGMAWAPDGSRRLFISVKAGEVRIIENGALIPTPFATITPVLADAECGVLGLAFDPDFADNGFVYFFVTISSSEQQIIRYTAHGNIGSDKTTVVAGLATIGITHNGGAVGFGPDGKLYFAVGDNSVTAHGDKDLSSTSAKVSRVNRDGSAPHDNPFFDGPGPNEDRTWALGFRNPFSFAFQPATDLLWVNVVGEVYEQVFIVRAGENAGWLQIENKQPLGFSTPIVAYLTRGVDAYALAPNGASRKNGVTTFQTVDPHRLRLGSEITASALDPSFNLPGFVSTIPSATEVSIAQAGPDATSGGGAIRTANIGGAITGGAFWNSSGVPSGYRGDFFFGDFVSGRVQRVDLSASNLVSAVRDFGSGFPRVVDVSVGPDGDLYYVDLDGHLRHVSYNFSEQALVVSHLYLRAAEGGKAALHVRLATPPTAPVNVSVARSSGDADVSVKQGAALSFDPTTWATPQPVELEVAQDDDSAEDTATLTVSSAGLATENVIVRVTDDEPLFIVLSATSVALDEGGTGGLGVSLSGPPAGPLIVSVARTAGSSDVLVAQGSQLFFDRSNFSTPQNVGLTARADDDLIDDVATLAISAFRLLTREASVNVRDGQAPVITTSPVTTAVAGSPYSYDVEATGVPKASFALGQAPPGMTIDGATGLISWTPAARGSFDVNVRAMNGIAPEATQAFAIAVQADRSRAGAAPSSASEGGCGCRTERPLRSQTPITLLLAALSIAAARRNHLLGRKRASGSRQTL